MLNDGDYGAPPDTMKPLIQEGFDSSTKGAQTIQEILNAANIKSGKVEYAQAPFSFKNLVEGIIQNLKPNADSKGVALTLSVPDEDVTLVGDQMQMENAIKNLVDNAVKYTPKGSIAASLTNDGTTIRFTTKDTGVGITPDDMQRLFTEGGHGAESTKVNVDSTGFGLYIVKNIIEAHGGKVWAESEGKDKGSTFVVELPAGKA
jgi:signal transduction histidine kinase